MNKVIATQHRLDAAVEEWLHRLTKGADMNKVIATQHRLDAAVEEWLNDQVSDHKSMRNLLKDMVEFGRNLDAPLPNGHISDLPLKQAWLIVGKGAEFVEDPYHRNIVAAANVLSAAGKGYYVYQSQYPSGNTLWVDLDAFARFISAIVTTEGEIK